MIVPMSVDIKTVHTDFELRYMLLSALLDLGFLTLLSGDDRTRIFPDITPDEQQTMRAALDIIQRAHDAFKSDEPESCVV
jgi:hypothetical protein